MWDLSFIGKDDFTKHVKETIKKYDEKLEPFDLVRFNKNIIDPIKLIFDKNVYNATWGEIISNEIFRQRDKSNSNDIGYFHQNIFQYINKCEVPKTGWDVIFSDSEGIQISESDSVKTIYVEMKNKHNTMNSASAKATYMKMQNQLLNDDDCACFLVEVVAKKSANIKWETTIDRRKVGHKLMRRVSIDKFYSMVTGVEDAFYRVCMALPTVIQDVVSEMSSGGEVSIPKDTVFDELKALADKQKISAENLSFAMAAYLLGFSTYAGFSEAETQ